MHHRILCVIGALVILTQEASQPPPASPQGSPAPGASPHIVAYSQEGFQGKRFAIFGPTANLGPRTPRIASMVIVAGCWEFVDEAYFKGATIGVLGPGVYHRVQDYGLQHTKLSLVRLVSPQCERS